MLALEPEAASIYCQHLPIERFHGSSPGFVMTEVGTKYMVVDLGGILINWQCTHTTHTHTHTISTRFCKQIYVCLCLS
jgi:hypothetical protein